MRSLTNLHKTENFSRYDVTSLNAAVTKHSLCHTFTQEALSNIEGVNPQNALQILDKMSEKTDDKK